jgi:hypothetical protein
MLQDLYDQLASSFPASVRKDLQTAIRVCAKALHYPDPQHCPLDQFRQPLPTLYHHVETYLIAQGKSAHTLRNTKNNLSRLWRTAEKQELFTPIPLVLTPRYTLATKPCRPGGPTIHHSGHYLPYRQWPLPLQESFMAFTTWATTPVVSGRKASLRKRPTTIENYRRAFEGYFGFLHHIQQLPTLTFDQLFDLTLVTAFVHWHINKLQHRPTEAMQSFLVHLLALTKQYRPLPALREQLVALRKTLPAPLPSYNKEDAWVPLAMLDEIGRTLWPQRSPPQLRQDAQIPGQRSALDAALSLMFRLWFYIPYRQRNMREMQLDENLHKDANGQWRITFRGEQLKIATKRGRLNTFDLPFPSDLVPQLEEYLNVWRPILLRKASHPCLYVFPSTNGTCYRVSTFHRVTSQPVYRYTGKHWHPHIVRSVWATEWIRNGGDFYTAAIMLNDTLETLIANYAHLRDENIAEEVYATLKRRNSQGT